MNRKFLAFLAHFATYGATGDLQDSGMTFIEEGDEETGEEADETGDSQESEDGDSRESEEDVDTAEDEESEDGDEEDGESDDEESGEGADEEEALDAGPGAMALEQAVLARLNATNFEDGSGELALDLPSTDELKQMFPSMHETDLQGIKSVSEAIIKQTLSGYDKSRVGAVMSESAKNKRNAELQEGVRVFMDRYPNAFDGEGVQKAMTAKYHDLAEKVGITAADSVTVEEYYLMVGGRDRPVKKGRTSAAAKTQKRKAVRATRKAGSIGKVRSGGKRKRSKDASAIAENAKFIQSHHFSPFEMPG